jgi:predicted methyltransferase
MVIEIQTLNATRLAQTLLLPKIASAKCLVDATAGNGKDTLFLAKNSLQDGVVYGFDIQSQAIEATRKRLSEHQLADKVKLILDSHINFGNYITTPIDVAMFNLGYLPGECHEMMTMAKTTVVALTAVVQQLAVGGMISVVAYPGHEQGQEENIVVRNYIMTLSAKIFTVICIDMINHTNNPPILYLIEKIKNESGVGQ